MAAEAAISSAVQLLGDLLIQKVKSVRGVEGKVQSLKEELEWMRSFLKEANKNQAEDEGVRNWIKKMREVAQDAQDTIEMFLLNVEIDKSRGPLERLTRFPTRIYHIDKIGDEIESIRRRLADIDKSRERYGIRILQEAAADSSSTGMSQVELRRRLAPWEKDEHLVGIEDDVRKLLRESVLSGEKEGLSVAVLKGMGGIGKSTLAREIYNHPDVVVAGQFDFRGWVVVLSEFTPQETIKQLIIQFPRSEEEKKNLQEVEETTKDKLYLLQKLQEMLHKQLEGKTYFIVLDDLWEKEHWAYLKSAFPNQQGKTSRLLVTTRNKIIIKSDQYEHEMKGLDSEKGWELLLKKAFIGYGNGKCPQDLESIGRQILEKCRGLPLAITVVGGVLMETQTKSGWEQVLNQINFYLGRGDSSVSAILELSYQNLSPQLKSCFLCLAFFKEDFTIPTKRVVNIWVAQDLIQQDGRGTIDEIARSCLNELINRSMVQIDDFMNDDRVKSCRLHDLLREVCLSKAEEEMGLKILKGEEGFLSESSYKPRHLVVYTKDLKTFSSNQNKHLRSLFLLNVGSKHVFASHYWKSFQLLKILDLDGFAFEKLPGSFRFLLGLKYFRIRRDQSIISYLQLPSWFDHLKKLEVFDVEKSVVEFPNVALKMERLRHFHVYCVTGGAMKVEKWKSIESLKLMRLDDWLECSSTLTANCHLRELGIWIDGMEGSGKFSRVRASLEKMTNLVELHLRITRTFTMEEIIPNLDGLTILKVDGGMVKCPAASVFPPNLTHLTLDGRIEDQILEELGKLPKLLYLTLSSSLAVYRGDRMKVLHDGFPCLKALSLNDLRDLRCIHIKQGGMPRLKQLQIHDCPRLETHNLPEHIIILAV